MSIDAFIFTRTEPAFGMQDHDVVTIESVQILKPRRVEPDDWRRIGRKPDPTIVWLTDANCNNRSWPQLEMFAQGLARRCGGGLWWCDLTGDVIEVAPRPDPGTWSLRRALEIAQDLESDLDQADMDDDEPGESERSFSVGAGGQFTVHGQVARGAHSGLEWEIGFAKRGSADVWTGTASFIQVFALLEGHGANQVGKYVLGTMRRALDHMRRHSPTNPIEAGYAAEAPSAWIKRTHDHALATTFKKPLLKRRPQGWGTLSIVKAEGAQLTIAHVGDSRAYLLGARGVQQLATEQVNAHTHRGHFEPSSAIGSEFFKPEERTVQLERDDALLLISYEVWDALGAKLESVVLEALIQNAQAAADMILSHATATCGVVLVAFYGGRY